ncbi:hypothetical protein V5N11_035665 [Cardamine amara subsp. amara]|uniref:DUF4283 domain-containing protein n=1 Tax=Cardamine amara subsp. amara TaxID=228776 RepID=A0ABD1BNU2_CARAN
MSDKIHKRMQDITLGVNDTPIALPKSVFVQATRANRLSIVGTLVNPRKQNMKAQINHLPRVWGMEDTVVGRIVDAWKFQFVFQSEESLNLVLRHGPWSFSEWMIVTHKWIPNMSHSTMKSIPLWTQIHGIPSQYLTLEMVNVIGRSLGHVSGVDFNENATRINYVRVRLDWNIDHPLRFKREFQFRHNESAILSFYYERLRNFCSICGMINHEKKECSLRFDVGEDDDDAPEDNDEDNANHGADHNDDGNQDDENPDLNENDNVKMEKKKIMKIDARLIASISCLSEAFSEKYFSLILDNDMSAET